MRILFTCILYYCFAFTFAQQTYPVNSTLKFEERFTKCERKWVVLPKVDTAKSYSFGYIYIDEAAGFTYDLKGVFIIDSQGKYISDTTASKNTSIKYRIAPTWRYVALLNPQHFDELKIKAPPIG